MRVTSTLRRSERWEMSEYLMTLSLTSTVFTESVASMILSQRTTWLIGFFSVSN